LIRVYVNQHVYPVLIVLPAYQVLMPERRRITIRRQSGGGPLHLPPVMSRARPPGKRGLGVPRRGSAKGTSSAVAHHGWRPGARRQREGGTHGLRDRLTCARKPSGSVRSFSLSWAMVRLDTRTSVAVWRRCCSRCCSQDGTLQISSVQLVCGRKAKVG
jgi:hypothetical protein